MANFKFCAWLSKRYAIFLVISFIFNAKLLAADAVAEVTKVAPDMSLSDVVNALKKEDKQKRSPGFRTKLKPDDLQQLPSKEPLSLAEKSAEASPDREIKRKKTELEQIKEENKRLEHDILSLMGENLEFKEWTAHALPDITPAFPGYARLIGNEGMCHAALDYETSAWCFDDRGKVVDLSKLIVGYEQIEVQDIDVVARLARNSSTKQGRDWLRNDNPALPGGADRSKVFLVGDVALDSVADTDIQNFSPTTIPVDISAAITAMKNLQIQNHYLNRIADKVLEFKAESKAAFLNLNLTQLLNKVFSIGIEVPVVFMSNKIAMFSALTTTELDELSSAAVKAQNQTGEFFVRYPNGLQDFYNELLLKKGFIKQERHNLMGLGDVTFFINRKINAPEFVKAGVVGIGITAPSGTKTDNRYLWPVVLGNGGFWELRAHTSLFWRNSGFFNPHFFGELRFRIGSSVERRVSRIVSRKQTSLRDIDGLRASNLPTGSGFVFNPEGKDFKEAESLVPAFAQAPLRSIDINRGLQAKVRVGNLFNGVIFDNAYLDVFYEAAFEQEDNLGFRQINPEYDIDAAMLNTGRHSHVAGAVYCYRLHESLLLEASISHVAIGKNTGRATKFGCAMQYNF